MKAKKKEVNDYEATINLIKQYVELEYHAEATVWAAEDNNLPNFTKLCDLASEMSIAKAMIVTVKLGDVELIRYIGLDIEFNFQKGKKKIGITGRVSDIDKFFGNI